MTLTANVWLYFATMFIKLPTDAAVKKAKRVPEVKSLRKVSRSIPGIGVIVSILVGFSVYRGI